MIENDNFISKLTGINEVKLEWVKLIIPEGGLIGIYSISFSSGQ